MWLTVLSDGGIGVGGGIPLVTIVTYIAQTGFYYLFILKIQDKALFCVLVCCISTSRLPCVSSTKLGNSSTSWWVKRVAQCLQNPSVFLQIQ